MRMRRRWCKCLLLLAMQLKQWRAQMGKALPIGRVLLVYAVGMAVASASCRFH